MERELGVGRVEITGGALDGMEGVLDRLYWEGDVQYADCTLATGEQITVEIMRRETAADASLPRELGS